MLFPEINDELDRIYVGVCIHASSLSISGIDPIFPGSGVLLIASDMISS